ncbi:MAG: hypothetical protein F4222_08990 [Gammaproteobacteria bacterium]|nr:hypothetical protein [Gammaproteobacteria bacterium]MYF59189.1 hypothetical protein [Gammaproteobacteria bacterium]
MDESFLSLLRCPRTGGELRPAGAEELAVYNKGVGEGRLSNAAGRKLTQAMEGALVSECRSWLYPVHEGIPVLLVEEAVALADTCA